MKNPKYRRWVLLLSVVLALCFGPSSFAHEPLTSHSAYYHVHISVLRGAMVTNLRNVETEYHGTSSVFARGLARIATRGSIEGSTRFNVTDSGVRPIEYIGSDTIARDREQTTLVFDWTNMRLTGQTSRQEGRNLQQQDIDEEIGAGSNDPLSLQYSLMVDLINDRLQKEYLLVDGTEQKVINIKRLEETEIEVPFGSFRVIPIQHQAENSSRITTFWFAKALNYLPVMIAQYKGDKQLMRAELGNYEVSLDK